tara:strand:- start:2566 stop:2808 length:243 start_codon:yes stop_codon:yes gene_type:complete
MNANAQKAVPDAVEELQRVAGRRITITQREFLDLLGWSESKCSRLRKKGKITVIDGYGQNMILVSEVARIIGKIAEGDLA